MAGHTTNTLTPEQQHLLDRLLPLGWRLSGSIAEEADHDVDRGFRQIYVASEAIDDLQDSIHPVEAPLLNSDLNCGLADLFSGLIKLPPNCVRHTLQSIHGAIKGQTQDVSTRITHASLHRDGITSHCEAVSTQKTGGLIQLAFTLPWLSRNETADAPPTAIVELGKAGGIAIQALNDWSGVSSATESEDVFHGRVTWIWEWLSSTLADDEFEELRAEAATCIGHQQLAREFRMSLVEQLDEPLFFERVRDRYRSALSRIPDFDNAATGSLHKSVGAEFESIIFSRNATPDA